MIIKQTRPPHPVINGNCHSWRNISTAICHELLLIGSQEASWHTLLTAFAPTWGELLSRTYITQNAKCCIPPSNTRIVYLMCRTQTWRQNNSSMQVKRFPNGLCKVSPLLSANKETHTQSRLIKSAKQSSSWRKVSQGYTVLPFINSFPKWSLSLWGEQRKMPLKMLIWSRMENQLSQLLNNSVLYCSIFSISWGEIRSNKSN